MKNVYSLVSIYFYLLSASVYSAPVENEPSIAVEDPSGIVGGEPVGSSAKYPWMVSLQRSPVGPGKAFCGGSLIAPNVVMTAAHCTSTWGRPNSYAVTSRRYDLSISSMLEGGIDFNVTAWYTHPKYSRAGGAPINDIALWIVDVNRNWANNDVAFAQYSTDALAPVAPENVTVIGWGATGEQGPQSKVLLETQVPTIDTETCRTLYSRNSDAITDSVICAGFVEGGKDTCQGDSGGPLFRINAQGNAVVEGLTSWGEGCARRGKPGVYTRVGEFAPWIKSILDKHSTNSPIEIEDEQ